MKIIEKVNSPDDLKKLNRKELNLLCRDIRDFITENVSKNGGHLAPSLGVVELTVALHYYFNSPEDKIIWDVGHQSYAHKILTGRKKEFPTIRKYKGLSGFPKSDESPHDQFDTGHSSTSLSVALGFAKARDLKKKNYKVIPVIGDGALTGGMALEALNHLGYLQSNMTIVLNDNKMSISENVGALSEYTFRITQTRLYRKIKRQLSGISKEIKDKTELENLKKELKQAASPNFLFEKLGIEYIGPIDGHSIPALLKAFKKSEEVKGPVILHVKTKKGKGYSFAEQNSTKFHGISKFDIKNGKKLSAGSTYTSVFSETICRIAKKNKKVVAVTAAMCEGTGLAKFSRMFPERFFDTGIAEQHAVGMCAGLAKKGFTPVLAIYSTFLQRAYDQVIHDVCLQKLPVVFCIDRAGLVGEDGPTHHGVFDLSYLLHIPNLTIMAPKDKDELVQMIHYAVSLQKPVAIRYPKEKIEKNGIDFSKNDFFPSSELLAKGKKGVIIPVGSMVAPAIEAVEELNKKKPVASLINPKVLKPLDKKIINYSKKIGKVLVVEENSMIGGFGSFLNEKINDRKTQVNIMGIRDCFVPHGDRKKLLSLVKLTKKDIIKNFNRMI